MGVSPKNIGLFGLFGSGNLGNDGSLEAMLNFLRTTRPDAKLVCICADPHKIQSDFHVEATRIGAIGATNRFTKLLERFLPTRKLLQLLEASKSVRKFDLIIVPGTGILDDYGENFWGMPATLFGWCLAAKLSGTNFAFVSIGAGPIDQPISRWLMKQAARMAQYRSFRDTISKEFICSLGLDASGDAVYPDIAFALPAPPSMVPPPSEGETYTVAVGVMAYHGWRGQTGRGASIYEAYLKKLRKFVLWLLDRGHHVRVLMGESTDQDAVDDLLKALAIERPDYPRDRIVAEPTYSLHDLMRQIAAAHVVVATRYHNIVCALKLDRPTVSIGYAKKNDVLMTEMGLGEFCQHVEQLDVDLLIKQFTRLVSRRPEYEAQMRRANVSFQERLRKQEAVLTATLL